jgi:hypothetical protein
LPPWSKWKKPWSKEQCRRRYVEGDDDIGIRPLSVQAGRAKSTLQRWAGEEIDGLNWSQQRVQFRSKLSAATQEKTIAKTSERLAEDIASITIANYAALKAMREYAAYRTQLLIRDAARIQKNYPPEQQLEECERAASDRTIETISRVLQRAVTGINETMGLKYHVNINAAIDKAISDGYVVTEPDSGEEEYD